MNEDAIQEELEFSLTAHSHLVASVTRCGVSSLEFVLLEGIYLKVTLSLAGYAIEEAHIPALEQSQLNEQPSSPPPLADLIYILQLRSRKFETLESLLSQASPRYKLAFQNALTQKLLQLLPSQEEEDEDEEEEEEDGK